LASRSRVMPLDITIPGRLSVSTTWEKLPGALMPWRDLRFWMDVAPSHKRGQGIIKFRGHLRYHSHGWQTCRVRSLPEGSGVQLSIRPYMDPPVYSNLLTVAQVFEKPFPVELPYGWYNFRWGITCSGLTVRSHMDYIPNPFALARPPDD